MTPQEIAHDIVLYAIGSMGVELDLTQQVELEAIICRAINKSWESGAISSMAQTISMLHTLN
jgi:hypothetical protein